jgi:hypothetical protein
VIDSRSVFAEVPRRDGERWLTEIVRGPGATLASIGHPVRMADLYEGMDFAASATGRFEPCSRGRPPLRAFCRARWKPSPYFGKLSL